MNSTILFRTSLFALRRHKIRSFLTILGIMFGIGAIIVTFSIGTGAEEKVREQIMSMGEGAIYIIPGNIVERGAVRSNLLRPPKLKKKDIYSLIAQIDQIELASHGHDSLQLIEYGTKGFKERVYGTDANMLQISGHALDAGRYLNDVENKTRANVVVLGNAIAKKLFGIEDPIGKTVNIDTNPFTVIGVVEDIDYFWSIQDPNMRVYVPFETAKKYFRKPKELEDDLGFIALKVGEQSSSKDVLRVVKRTLRMLHDLETEDQDDFTIFDQETVEESATSASNIIKLFGLIAASISLLVGGIGIMNIMLVSVKERVREIGIRLALGATSSDIQLQFLFEAFVLAIIGGLLGVLLGFAIQYALTIFTNLPGRIEAIPVLISFLLTTLIGIFFGYYPAYQASQLNPVDALHEK